MVVDGCNINDIIITKHGFDGSMGDACCIMFDACLVKQPYQQARVSIRCKIDVPGLLIAQHVPHRTANYPQLKSKYIDTGKAKLVFREYPLDDRAMAASMLARCVARFATTKAVCCPARKRPRSPKPLHVVRERRGLTNTNGRGLRKKQDEWPNFVVVTTEAPPASAGPTDPPARRTRARSSAGAAPSSSRWSRRARGASRRRPARRGAAARDQRQGASA